jgi:hypothetical protein
MGNEEGEGIEGRRGGARTLNPSKPPFPFTFGFSIEDSSIGSS